MTRRTQQCLTIRDHPADAAAFNLAAARDRELVDSILRHLVARVPTPASPPGDTVTAVAVQSPQYRSTTRTLTTDATPQPKGCEHVA